MPLRCALLALALAACSNPIAGGAPDAGAATPDGAFAATPDGAFAATPDGAGAGGDLGASDTRRDGAGNAGDAAFPGDASGGAGDASGSAGDASGSGGTACAELEVCCQTIGGMVHDTCEGFVQRAIEQSCSNALATFRSSGYCIGGTNCAMLSACCPMLPTGSSQTLCNDIATANSDTQCDQRLQAFIGQGYCNGTPDSCTPLAACCPSVPAGAQQMACQSAVAGNNYRTCASELMQFQNAGYCP